jgi:mono/diheme cytochrome c family protein/rhodanese-related sulfurtransferase
VNRAVLALVLVVSACNSGSAKPDPAKQRAGAGSGSGSGSGAAKGRAAAPSPARPAVSPEQAAQFATMAGKPLYLALCKPCHGEDAKGYAADHAPSLVNPTFLESATDAFLRQSIIAGRPGTSMAAYGAARGGPLDAGAIDRIVGWLREQGPAAQPLPRMTAGDAATGAAVYAKRCMVCHGDRRTRGEAPSLVNPGFLADATDAFLRHAVVHGRPGTKMEAFAGALTDAEIDGVVTYIRTLGAVVATVDLLPEPTGVEPLVIHPSGKQPSFQLRADPCPPGTVPPAAPLGAAPPANAVTCKQDPKYVSVEQVAAAFAAGQRMVIIDARAGSDWRRVHITGAVSIPYLDMKRLDEVPRDDTWVIAYCACPHHLSGLVVDELRKRGHANSVILDEGINEWHRRGLPVVAAPGVGPPMMEPRGPSPFGASPFAPGAGGAIAPGAPDRASRQPGTAPSPPAAPDRAAPVRPNAPPGSLTRPPPPPRPARPAPPPPRQPT